MMEKIAICAIFKDEAPYLLEWIAFHRMIGVDLFVLYNNGSNDGGAELVRQSSFARNEPGTGRHRSRYISCVRPA